MTSALTGFSGRESEPSSQISLLKHFPKTLHCAVPQKGVFMKARNSERDSAQDIKTSITTEGN